MNPVSGTARTSVFWMLVAAVVLVSVPAFADVRLEGDWPDAEKPVSLDARELSRAEAIRRLADVMGWSVMVHAPSADPVDLHVKEQPASKVLQMLLSDQSYVAKRDGDLISITRDTDETPEPSAEAPPSPPVPPPASSASAAPPPPPPAPSAHAADRVVSGGSVRVEAGETVRDVVVFGGSVDVFGTALGDVTVIGGSAKIHAGAHVHGDATAVGGSLNVDDGATVDGDVGVVGGVLHRGKKANIGGDERTGRVKVNVDHPDHDASSEKPAGRGWSLSELSREVGEAMTRSALLFVFGAVMLALATRRMDDLQQEVAARPMRSFALGIVGALAGTMLLVALTITVIGIPIAVIAVLLGVMLTYASICAVLTVVGAALLRHKTKNPYIHLALGCALFLIVGAIPYLGTLTMFTVVLMGMGSLVATRGAGLFVSRKLATAAG